MTSPRRGRSLVTSATRLSPILLRRSTAFVGRSPGCVVRSRPRRPSGNTAEPILSDEVEPGEVELQASWASGQVVVWASGRGATPESHDDLSTRLEAIGGPPLGWLLHPGVQLPGGMRADALAIPVKDALGWLVAVGGGHGRAGVGAGVLWLGHVALEGVRLAASGSIVPALRVPQRPQGRLVNAEVRWRPALTDSPAIAALAAAMPGTVAAIDGGTWPGDHVCGDHRRGRGDRDRERRAHGAAGPSTDRDVGEGRERRVDRPAWTAHRSEPRRARRRRVEGTRELDAHRHVPVASEARRAARRAWSRRGLAAVGPRTIRPRVGRSRSTLRCGPSRGSRPVSAEWARLGRLFPALNRSGAQRRGQVALSQDEAWEFMTVDGPALAAVGFDVRAPALSRRKATPSLRLFAETPAGSVVGAHQLSNVAWSVLFDDVELTAAEVAQLARQARPLVQSSRGWVEIDRVDLEQAAAALAEREQTNQLTRSGHPAPQHRPRRARAPRWRRRAWPQLGHRHRRAGPARRRRRR